MSRNFLPAVMAIGMGVFTGMYIISLRLRMAQNRKLTGIAIRILHLPTSITRQTI